MQIPSIIHQIWIQGIENLPRQYRRATERWRARNAGWTHCLWDGASLAALMAERAQSWADLYARQPEVEARADVGRYAVLDALGGVYADIDTECRRPIEPLLAAVPAALQLTCYSGDSREPIDCATNSVIACTPAHAIWSLVKEAVAGNPAEWPVVLRTGPDMLRPLLRQYEEAHPGSMRIIGFPEAFTTAMVPRRTMRVISWMRRENCVLDFNDSARRAARERVLRWR